MRVAIYARVSTKDKGQETENQLIQLREFCDRQGWQIVLEFTENKSGKNSARAMFQAMLKAAANREFDLLLFWALDRFSREGVLATLQGLEQLNATKVAWRSYTESWLDSAGIFKEALIAIMATLAKQERIKMSERTLAGLERARRQGKVLGRRKRIFDRSLAAELHSAGRSYSDVARELGVPKSTVVLACRGAA